MSTALCAGPPDPSAGDDLQLGPCNATFAGNRGRIAIAVEAADSKVAVCHVLSTYQLHLTYYIEFPCLKSPMLEGNSSALLSRRVRKRTEHS